MTAPLSGLCPARLERAERLVGRFVQEGKLAGAVTLVARGGETVTLTSQGWQDRERGLPMREDSLFRIYSMTKIVTTVGILALYEQGLLDLNDPVGKHLPGFRNLSVRLPDGSEEPSARDMTIYDLLRHCGGIPYIARTDLLRPTHTLEDLAAEYAKKPLAAQPGTKWMYSESTDILARIAEVVSGRRHDIHLRETIFEPLEMKDTGYFVEDARSDRLCVCYRHAIDGSLTVQDGAGPESPYRSEPRLFGGGSGLVSSVGDYQRFATMLLRGGAWRDRRILGRKTVELMTLDHLPEGHPHLSIGTQCFRFGLGVSVVTDVARSRCLSSPGDYGWGGAAGTQVWISPAEDLIVMIMIQVRADIPTGIMDIYKRLVYQALVN